ncbi:MAG: dihydropteroate synthase [Candidatus Rokuibacteriota bacterium]
MNASGVASLAGVPVGGEHPVVVMGVLNVSPESFYPGSVHRGRDELVRAAHEMVSAGAALIDVGARSTAPYLASTLGEAEECERLARAIEVVAAAVPVPVSADTTRPGPARAALAAGARVINDVSGLRDAALGALARARGASVILMASPEGPGNGTDPVATVGTLLEQALGRAGAAGIASEGIVLDPGIGFFREEAVAWDEWDFTVLACLSALAVLGRPLGIGVSRKSFLGAVTGQADPAGRLAGSLAATAVAVLGGAALVRTHDVAATVQAVRVAERLRRTRVARTS